ncbi:histidine kinase N-terminal 7TM domain-containing protein [Chloroflexus sp.]|uniref:histidine kinase N-terminal 7TM domain-containing protein n=1 Tax=Chloroflexus sp. TaxID=1904827 RepID=UPI002ACDF104|nr:histidine kinase N-terminal 7TM domain-containing protein [Chloroflexus sp.]
MLFNAAITISLLWLVCLIAIGVAIYLWPRRGVAGGYEFLLMLAAIVVWAGADALELSATTLESKLFWRLFQQVGIVVLPSSWLLFTFAYLDFQPWSRSRARWLIFAFPLLTLLIAFTNHEHHLFFHGVRLSLHDLPHLEIIPGRWFWVHIGYSYICLTAGLALITGAFWQTSPLFRQQAILIALGFLFPFLFNWSYLSQVTLLDVDITPVSFLLSAPFIITGLYRYRFLHLVPVARDRLIEAMADAMIVTDQSERIIDLNPAAQRLFNHVAQVNTPLAETLDWPALIRAAQSHHPVRIELNCPEHPDRFFDITIDPLYDRKGQFSGRIFVFREITERKRVEQRLHEALQRFTDMIERTPLVAIQRFDRHGVVLEWNRVCEQFYGYTTAEACGRRLQDLILSGNEIAEFERQIEHIWTSGQAPPPRTWQIHTKTGEVCWFYSAMFPLFAHGQVSDIVCMDVDITEIRLASDNLRRQRDQLAALHRLTLDWLNRREMNDLLQAITDSAYRVLNVSYVELLLAEDANTLVVRACTPSLPRQVMRRETPTKAPLSWRAFRDRQPTIVLNYTAWPEHTPDYEQFNFGPAMTLPIIVSDECLGVIGIARNQHDSPFTTDEIQHAMLLTQLAALVLDSSNLYAAAQREIEERKQAEQQRAKLQAQLLQAQKMEAIGQLAGGIAHDFNNILTVITGSVELALLELEADHPIYPELESIHQSANRATELVRQLLTFARRQPGQPQLIDVNRQINDTMNMMTRLIGEHIQLKLELNRGIDQVLIDPHQFEQILINLVVNARDAMPDGGTLTIRTASQYFSAGEIPVFSQAQAGKYVLLTIADTGIGIDESIQPHIFEPYFTTKPIGKGSGLGLAICNGIVSQHGGFVIVESQPNTGSCFTVALPATASAPMTMHDPIDAELVINTSGHETILLVEDEPHVRQLATRLLREHGYTVLEASQAREALQLAQQYGDDLQLMLTDIVLPQMDGVALAHQMQTLLPHLRVILMSGYLQHLQSRHELPYPVLSKPFNRQQLLAIIRQTIDQTS